MVTHDPHAAGRAQRIIHLEKGRIVGGDTMTKTALAGTGNAVTG
jgi:ABC-type lipoprotein export system ATPase subunit